MKKLAKLETWNIRLKIVQKVILVLFVEHVRMVTGSYLQIYNAQSAHLVRVHFLSCFIRQSSYLWPLSQLLFSS